ncbi:alpha/beta fold hydrolase [Streptomyces sp. NPDC056390]|uniref:alpha/beta fold hydrolase n=1 Tax=Streptomyces sp. NPDC056390 TaxID=3345806 RepID=UPI0035D701E1
MTTTRPDWIIIPGAGGVGLTWKAIAEKLDATILPIPFADSVTEIAEGIAAKLPEHDGPRYIIGASSGSMVALELARLVRVDGCLFTASGFGIEVSDRLLRWLADDPPGIHTKIAKIGLADDGADRDKLDAVVADYDACGAELHVSQLSAIARYRPDNGMQRPFSFVLWGDHDRSIPFEAHRVLAVECGGALVPLENCGHLVHVDRPDAVVAWARRLEALTTR